MQGLCWRWTLGCSYSTHTRDLIKRCHMTVCRYGEVHPHFYMGPLSEAIKEANGSSAKEVRLRCLHTVAVAWRRFAPGYYSRCLKYIPSIYRERPFLFIFTTTAASWRTYFAGEPEKGRHWEPVARHGALFLFPKGFLPTLSFIYLSSFTT